MTSRVILLVDDDVKVLLALKKRLEHEGYRVITATSGEDALERMVDAAVDVVSLDVNMPGGLSGLDVAAALRADPHTANVPIIFVTGSADEEFKQRCTAVGGRYFLAKPFDSDLLCQMLKGIFARDELAEIQRISHAKRRQPVG